MTCSELQRVLPEIVEGGRNAEQEAHLRSCPACAGVVSDLGTIASHARLLQAADEPHPRVWNAIRSSLDQWDADLDLISEQARGLQASEDPSPRVWNSIEIALRQEGLIRKPQTQEPKRSFFHWAPAWGLPIAAAVIVVFGILLYQGSDQRAKIQGGTPGTGSATVQPGTVPMDANDQQLLAAVASRSPAVRQAYETSLRRVNAYIRDAKQTVDTNPNDEEAAESLMDAYQQKSMVYEMALDRSLP